MKNIQCISIMILLLFSFCSPTRKMQFYNQFKQEIVKDVFHEFEKFLPDSYENSLMAEIRYAPSFKVLECSGIDVLFGFNDLDFEKIIQFLYLSSIVPSELFHDTIALNRSNSEYYSLDYDQQKIAIPRVNQDFCRINDTCFIYEDLETIILEVGEKEIFSKNISSEYPSDELVCNYSIGALISKQKQHII